MNYIFLDVDGVLNSQKYMIKTHKKLKKILKNKTESEMIYATRHVDTKAVYRLSKIVKATNAKIIMSSSWRGAWKYGEPSTNNYTAFYLNSVMHNFGIAVDDITTLVYHDRGEQILQYVFENLKPEDNWIVIDDEIFDIDRYISLDKVVKTNFKTGLLNKHIKEAILKMRKQK